MRQLQFVSDRLNHSGLDMIPVNIVINTSQTDRISHQAVSCASESCQRSASNGSTLGVVIKMTTCISY
eukprot:scaffold293818_cov19-Prasinocladus_malaysianus.AAC.1